MREETKEARPSLVSQKHLSFYIPTHLFTVSLILSIICTGYGWKCLDFDTWGSCADTVQVLCHSTR